MTVSKAEQARRVNYHYMADAMRMLEWDLHQKMLAELRIPAAWHEIAKAKGRSGRTRVTVRLDDDVVKFFRSMGEDWQKRLNAVASAWMHGRLAGLIEGAETMDYLKRREDDKIDYDGPRPRWAEMQRNLEAAGFGGLVAWGPNELGDPGVPVGEECSPEAELRERGRVLSAQRRWEGK